MRVWMLWVRSDDVTWLEAAWDDEMTASNPDGWRDEVDRVRGLGHEMRIQAVEVPGVYDLFEIPTATATVADA